MAQRHAGTYVSPAERRKRDAEALNAGFPTDDGEPAGSTVEYAERR
jgi:hypothetical protein